MILSFGEFQLDIDRFELRRNGQVCKTEPKVFDLMAHFARNPGRVFSRDDLIASVWQGRVVSDATVSTCIKSARKALGDSGGEQRYIKTVRGRGFQFAADVVCDGGVAKPDPKTRTPQPARQTGHGPSLLVVPLRVLSDGPDVVRLAEGISGALGTILTRVPLLRLSSLPAQYGGREITPSVREIHETTGVDYVVEGTLSERDGEYRINVQFADAKSGFRLWAEQFSVPGPAAAAHDRAVTAVIAKLEPQLYRAMYNTVRAAQDEPNAQALFLEASSGLAIKGWHAASFSEAAGLLRRSLKLDPDFALAAAYLSLVTGLGNRLGLTGNRDEDRAETIEAADRALELDSMDSTVLGYVGCALADIGELTRGIPILRNATELNPANAQAWAALGSACLLTGQVEEAVRYLTHGIDISPLDSRLSLWGSLLALALVQAKDLDGALRQAELACQRDYRSYPPRIVVGGIHLLRDQPELARQALADAYRIKPDLAPGQIFPWLGEKLGSRLLKLR